MRHDIMSRNETATTFDVRDCPVCNAIRQNCLARLANHIASVARCEMGERAIF